MRLKKLLAAVVSGALAVSAMAVTSLPVSAVPVESTSLYSKTKVAEVTETGEKSYTIALDGITAKEITKVDVNVTYNTYFNGNVEYTTSDGVAVRHESGGNGTPDFEKSTDSEKTEPITVNVSDIASGYTDGGTLKINIWWLNSGKVTINEVKVYTSDATNAAKTFSDINQVIEKKEEVTESETGNAKITLSEDINCADVRTVEAVISSDVSAGGNGCIQAADPAKLAAGKTGAEAITKTEWNVGSDETSPWTKTFTASFPDGISDDSLEVQIWWVNNNQTIKVESVVCKDADGNVMPVTGGGDDPNPPTPVDPDEPTPDNPPTPSGDAVTLWEETPLEIGWDDGVNLLKIPADKFATVKAGDTIKFTVVCGDNYPQLKFMDGSWTVLDSVKADSTYSEQYGTVAISGTAYTFVVTEADVATLKGSGMIVGGQSVTVSKAELIPGTGGGSTEEPDPVTLTISQESASLTTGGTVTLTTTPAEGVIWTTSNADVATVSGGVVTAVGAGTATITATLGDLSVTCTVTVTAPAPVIPSRPSNVPSAPVTPTVTVPEEPQLTGSVGKGWNAIEEKIAETADGGKVAVDMNGVTKLPKEVLDNISGEDVDLILNMKGGVTWTINGTDVDKASDIDMKVTVGTRAIPEEAIEAVEGGKSVKQISLAHNGTFGFTATMTISLGKLNDGQYANLFYYNPKSKSLEFVDASIISGGKANLIFNHASDYAIIMSDAPLGDYEDVSAAAGVISSESADTTVFFACGAVVLAVAAAYAIYRKRSRG